MAQQVRRKTLDKRARRHQGFGAVLFEMLTGTRACSGDETTYPIVAVISKERGWDAMPAAMSRTGDSSLVTQLEARPTSSPDRDIGRTDRASLIASRRLGVIVASIPEDQALVRFRPAQQPDIRLAMFRQNRQIGSAAVHEGGNLEAGRKLNTSAEPRDGLRRTQWGTGWAFRPCARTFDQHIADEGLGEASAMPRLPRSSWTRPLGRCGRSAR